MKTLSNFILEGNKPLMMSEIGELKIGDEFYIVYIDDPETIEKLTITDIDIETSQATPTLKCSYLRIKFDKSFKGVNDYVIFLGDNIDLSSEQKINDFKSLKGFYAGSMWVKYKKNYILTIGSDEMGHGKYKWCLMSRNKECLSDYLDNTFLKDFKNLNGKITALETDLKELYKEKDELQQRIDKNLKNKVK